MFLFVLDILSLSLSGFFTSVFVSVYLSVSHSLLYHEGSFSLHSLNFEFFMPLSSFSVSVLLGFFVQCDRILD